MLQHRLSRNMQLTLRGREYVVERRLPDKKIRIKDILTDQRVAICEQELADALFACEAELLGHDRNQDTLKLRLSKTKVSDITCSKTTIHAKRNCTDASRTSTLLRQRA